MKFINENLSKRSYSTWTVRTVRPLANRKVLLTTVISAIPVIIRCSYSINLAILNVPCFAMAMSTAVMTGKAYWNRSLNGIRDKEITRYFRGDAAFANPDIYRLLEAEDYYYAIRLKGNNILQSHIEHLLTRPVGRPPKKPIVQYHSFRYQAASWENRQTSRCESGMARRSVISERWFYRDQPSLETQQCGEVL